MLVTGITGTLIILKLRIGYGVLLAIVRQSCPNTGIHIESTLVKYTTDGNRGYFYFRSAIYYLKADGRQCVVEGEYVRIYKRTAYAGIGYLIIGYTVGYQKIFLRVGSGAKLVYLQSWLGSGSSACVGYWNCAKRSINKKVNLSTNIRPGYAITA